MAEKQQAGGQAFTPEQSWWLDQIAAHIGINLEMEPDDFSTGAFFQRGGQVAALRAFGGELMPVVNELNEALGGNERIIHGEHEGHEGRKGVARLAGRMGVAKNWRKLFCDEIGGI